MLFFVGSDGTGNGSDEEGSKVSAAGSGCDLDHAATADDAIDEEEVNDLAAEDHFTEDEEKTKPPLSSDGSNKDIPSVTTSKGCRKSKKTPENETPPGSSTEGTSVSSTMNPEELQTEPKKWNFRRNRPLLDFTTMEELNEMDDYDSEDDNDWRPNAAKKKSKAAAQKGGGGEEEDGSASDYDDDDNDEDDDDGDEDEDGKEDGDDENNSDSSDSEKEVKKLKKRMKSTSAFDEELTNDSMSQGKGNEVSSSAQ